MLFKKKVCLLGEFAVGKTCLMRRFVHGTFSERYIATIGVKIDRKEVRVGRHSIEMIIWDIAGGLNEGRSIPSYLGGLSGYFLVADGTRPQTLATAGALWRFVEDTAGMHPHAILLNKFDLEGEWAVGPAEEERLRRLQGAVFRTSAKTGSVVEDAFTFLAREMAPESS